eukprot:2467651-Pyramimonas_sp.AAC.1
MQPDEQKIRGDGQQERRVRGSNEAEATDGASRNEIKTQQRGAFIHPSIHCFKLSSCIRKLVIHAPEKARHAAFLSAGGNLTTSACTELQHMPWIRRF